MVLGHKDEVGVRIFEDLLMRLCEEECLKTLIVQLLPGLVGLLVDKRPRRFEESTCFCLDHLAVGQHEVWSNDLGFSVPFGQL